MQKARRLLLTSPFRIADPVDHFNVYHPIAVHKHYMLQQVLPKSGRQKKRRAGLMNSRTIRSRGRDLCNAQISWGPHAQIDDLGFI